MRETAPVFHEPPGDIYARLLRDYWRQGGEEPLIQAADLGKALVYAGRPPEEIGEFQQQALLALARELPAVTMDEAAARLTPPLIEVLIAYGLAFREQMKQRYESLIEQRLQQTHQMEALGTLAAGIAHDFNTILGVILGYTEMTLDEIPPGSAAQENLQQVVAATLRARNLVARILAFGRREEVSKVPVRLADSLTECLAMLRVTLPPSISLRICIDEPEALVLADPGELQQLIMDLTINAVHAITGCGLITYSLNIVTFNAHRLPPELSPGEHVRFRIRDTGCGIPRQIIDRIFEPFFTTKAVGQGSGLGLSVVYGIVKRLGGVINVYSEPGQGAEFEILCPRHIETRP